MSDTKGHGRYAVYVDGKWQGGTFGTENEAKAHAKTLEKTNEGKSVTVQQRNEPAPMPLAPVLVPAAPLQAPAVQAPAPSSKGSPASRG